MYCIYILNSQKNLSIIQPAPLGQKHGVVSSSDPIAFCFSDQFLVYHQAQFLGEPPLIDIRETLSAHITQGLIESTAMNLLS